MYDNEMMYHKKSKFKLGHSIILRIMLDHIDVQPSMKTKHICRQGVSSSCFYHNIEDLSKLGFVFRIPINNRGSEYKLTEAGKKFAGFLRRFDEETDQYEDSHNS